MSCATKSEYMSTPTIGIAAAASAPGVIAARPRVDAGLPYPLGATWDGKGVNFALFSANAEKVELCIFDARGRRVPGHADRQHRRSDREEVG